MNLASPQPREERAVSSPLKSLSPIDIEIIKGALRAAQREMEVLLERTAMSPFIREKKDYFTGIHGPGGEIIICTPIPFFGELAQPVLDVFPASDMRPGDIYWYNDCYGSKGAVSHGPDQVLLVPVFHEGELVGLTQTWAHFADIGGARPGSLSPHAVDIFQEGIIIPPVRLAREGVFNDDLIRLFERNSRFPKFIRGDMRAMIAAVRLGEHRLQELCERYSVADVHAAFREIIAQSERTIRDELRKTFKPGVYSFVDWVDQDGLGNGPYRIKLDLHSDDTGVWLDGGGSDDQAPGPVNFLVHPLVPKMMMGIYFTRNDSSLLTNDGCNVAIEKVELREGSILHPKHPAPLGQRGVTLIRLQSCVAGLINLANGGQGVAASNAYALYYMRGVDPKTGDNFLLTDGVAVGHGARSFADGHDGIYLVAQKNYPAEFLEATYPVRLKRYEINKDSGGPGRWRGGCGVIRDVEVLADQVVLSNRIDGVDYPPWGVSGGQAARSGRVVINPGGPNERVLPSMGDGAIVRKGEIVRIQTGGGGGWGNPYDREPDLVRSDVLGGFISFDSALADYGVVLGEKTFALDEEKTAAYRKANRPPSAMFHRNGYYDALP